MHPECRDAVARMVTDAGITGPCRVLDAGGADVNGSIRGLFHRECSWVAVDMRRVAGVTVVADASLLPIRLGSIDVALSTECFEYDPDWPSIVADLCGTLRPGGTLMVTCATEPRAPHSGIDGWQLRRGEKYHNVDPDELAHTVAAWLGSRPTMWTHPRGDVYCWGVKG